MVTQGLLTMISHPSWWYRTTTNHCQGALAQIFRAFQPAESGDCLWPVMAAGDGWTAGYPLVNGGEMMMKWWENKVIPVGNDSE